MCELFLWDREKGRYMNFLNFYRQLGFSCEMLKEIQAVPMQLDETLTKLFYYHRNQFFDKIDSSFSDPLRYQIYMKLYMQLLFKKYQNATKLYEKQQIKACMFDMLEWGETCHHFYNVWGIMPNMWLFLDRLIEGRIVHLHRLQFELKACEQDIETHTIYLPKGRVIINVHVPAGKALSHEECAKSYEEAASYFHGIPIIFHCESWLLSPKLAQCLNSSSNILKFQSDYEIYEVKDENHSMMERVWLDEEDDPSTYHRFEEKTTLQKNAKKILLKGETLQSAKGIFVYKGIPMI